VKKNLELLLSEENQSYNWIVSKRWQKNRTCQQALGMNRTVTTSTDVWGKRDHPQEQGWGTSHYDFIDILSEKNSRHQETWYHWYGSRQDACQEGTPIAFQEYLQNRWHNDRSLPTQMNRNYKELHFRKNSISQNLDMRQEKLQINSRC
jgi:hypothetical protein